MFLINAFYWYISCVCLLDIKYNINIENNFCENNNTNIVANTSFDDMFGKEFVL